MSAHSQLSNRPSIKYDEGIAAFKLGDLNAARDAFLSALKFHPKSPEILAYLGKTYQKLKHYDESKDAYKKAIGFDEDYAFAHLNYAHLYVDIAMDNKEDNIKKYKKYLRKAILKYSKAIELNPKSTEALKGRGFCNKELSIYYDLRAKKNNSEKYFRISNKFIKDAADDFDRVMKINPDDAYPYSELGHLYLLKNEVNNAIISFYIAIKKDKNYDDAYYGFGKALVRDNKSELAMYYLNVAIKLNPYHILAHNELSLIYDKKGYFDRAVEELEYCIRVKPYFYQSYYNLCNILEKNNYIEHASNYYFLLGNLLLEKKKYRPAIKAYRESIRLNPTFYKAYNNSGNSKFYLTKYRQAVKTYNLGIAKTDKHAELFYNLGNAHLMLKEYSEAVDNFLIALQIKEDYLDAFYNLGNAYLQQEKWDDAISAYEKATMIKRTFHKAYANIGNALYGKKELKEALEYFYKALKYEPKDSETFFNLATTYWSLRNIDLAEDNFKRSLFYNNNFLKSKLSLANMYFEVHDFQKAENLYNDIIANHSKELSEIVIEKVNKNLKKIERKAVIR